MLMILFENANLALFNFGVIQSIDARLYHFLIILSGWRLFNQGKTK